MIKPVSANWLLNCKPDGLTIEDMNIWLSRLAAGLEGLIAPRPYPRERDNADADLRRIRRELDAMWMHSSRHR